MIGWIITGLILVGLALVVWGFAHLQQTHSFGFPEPVTTIAGLICLALALLLGVGWGIYTVFFGG